MGTTLSIDPAASHFFTAHFNAESKNHTETSDNNSGHKVLGLVIVQVCFQWMGQCSSNSDMEHPELALPHRMAPNQSNSFHAGLVGIAENL